MNHPASPPALDRPEDPAPAASLRPTLDHLALLAVRGPDARGFLDTQLTRNVPSFEAGPSVSRASIAGYCSPKGRLLATFAVWADRSPGGESEIESIFMLVSRDIGETIARRLRMYVLRAKVVIEDLTTTHAIEGIPAAAAPREAASLDPWAVHRDGAITWVRFPAADGYGRLARVAPLHAAAPAEQMDAAQWRLADVRAGIPRITAPTQDRFVPQMVNLEALGGVDFKKGCFPGQEVVARSQYLGKLKRRMALASIAGDEVPQPATDVWSVEDQGPVGLVVNAELGTDGRVWLLVEIPLAFFDSHALQIAKGDGPALKIEELPYALPDNEVFVRPRL